MNWLSYNAKCNELCESEEFTPMVWIRKLRGSKLVTGVAESHSLIFLQTTDFSIVYRRLRKPVVRRRTNEEKPKITVCNFLSLYLYFVQAERVGYVIYLSKFSSLYTEEICF